jgi:hypothetical protein
MLLGVLAPIVAAGSLARAQSELGAKADPRSHAPAQVVLFRVAISDASLRELASALDSLLLAEVGKQLDGKVVAQHALDLPATQLALDCMAETPACLRNVARASDAQALVAATLERAGPELVLSLLYFADRPDDAIRHAARRQRRPGAERALLDSVPSLIAELRPRLEPPVAASRDRAARHAPRQEQAKVDRSAWPVVPVVLTSAGVALLGAGVGFGLAARASADDHAKAPTDSDAQVDAAAEKFHHAQTQETLSTVGLVLGAAALTAGVTLWAFDGSDAGDRPQAQLAAHFRRGGASLVFAGRFAEPGP